MSVRTAREVDKPRRRFVRAALPTALAALALALAGLVGVVPDSGAGPAPPKASTVARAGTWQQTPVPVEKGDITAVAALGEDRAWAIGYRLKGISELEPLALRWDGASWTQESTLPAGSFPQVLAVRSADDIWAAGMDTAHWDGRKWTTRTLQQDTAGRLYPDAMATGADGKVWLAGRAVPGSVKNGVPAIQSWDGTRWQKQTLPDVGKGELSSVVVVSSDDVWAAGATYATDDEAQTALLLHWDGTSWKKVAAPASTGRAGTWFGAMTALGPDDVWAVGGATSEGSDRPFAAHWDGKRWQVTPTPDVADGRLRSVGRTKDGGLWAIGGKGNVSTALRWDRAARKWTKAPAPDVVVRASAVVPDTSALWTVGIAKKGDLVPRITRFTG
jgi:hypothetical protein